MDGWTSDERGGPTDDGGREKGRESQIAAARDWEWGEPEPEHEPEPEPRADLEPPM